MLKREYERCHHIRKLAYRLAESGRFASWQEVQQALVEQSWADAPEALNHNFVRLSLDTQCAQAKKESDDAQGS